jgi:hypothetical protein
MDHDDQHATAPGDSPPPPRPGCLTLAAAFAILFLVASFWAGQSKREVLPALWALAAVYLLAGIWVVRELESGARRRAPRASRRSLARWSLGLGIAASAWALLALVGAFLMFGTLTEAQMETWWGTVIVGAVFVGLIAVPCLAVVGLALSVRAWRLEDADATANAATLLNGIMVVASSAWLTLFCVLPR